MSDERQRLLREVRRTVLVYNALTLVVGGILVIVAVRLAHSNVPAKSLEVIGTALASAALVSFVFGGVTVRDTTLQVRHAVRNAMHDTLQPLRDALHAEALAEYRWDCHLDAPAPGDSHPDYGYQLLRLSYRVLTVPRQLRMVCLASFSDDVLDAYSDDPRYVLRWLVDEGLTPDDAEIFEVIGLRVDGEPLLQPRPIPLNVLGRPGVEYRFPVPPAQRSLGAHTVELAVCVRKYIGSERRVRIQTQLFRPATDAEYRLTVGPGLAARKLTVQISEVSPLSAGHAIASGSTYPGRFGHLAGHAQFPFMLMKGSTVAFAIDRDANGSRTA